MKPTAQAKSDEVMRMVAEELGIGIASVHRIIRAMSTAG
jgi:hypothetical protein